MDNFTHFFGKVRVYSNANANKKFRAAADCIISLLENRHYDRNRLTREDILAMLKEKINALDNLYPRTPTAIAVFLTETSEAEYSIRMTAKKDFPVEIAEVLCFANNGTVQF